MRKKYLKPEVESETYVEQTSLGCNLIQGWEMYEDADLAFETDHCEVDVTKGGNWDASCSAGVHDFLLCNPSVEGIPLS